MPHDAATASPSRAPRRKTDLKLAARIHRRYREHGEAAGKAYAVQLVRQMPDLADQLYALMPRARAQTIRHAVAEQRTAKAAQQAAHAARVQQEQRQAQAAQQAHLEALEAQLLVARQAGEAVRWLAGLAPFARDRLATSAERQAAVALRAAGLLKGKVLAALGCTPAELERWHADGRLPHLYTRVLPLAAAGKAQACRFWAADVVTEARGQVDAWRVQDQRQPRRLARKAG